MTRDLTTRLTGTLDGLALGLPISALNRLRRREEKRKMTDAPLKIELHDGPSLAELRADCERRRLRVRSILADAEAVATNVARMPGAKLSIRVTTDRRDVIAAQDLGATSFVGDHDEMGAWFTLDDDGGTVTFIEARK